MLFHGNSRTCVCIPVEASLDLHPQRWVKHCSEQGMVQQRMTKHGNSPSQSMVQVDENEPATGYQTPTSPPKSELALQKGFRRRTWTGPAWLDNVTTTGHVNPHCTLPATFAT